MAANLYHSLTNFISLTVYSIFTATYNKAFLHTPLIKYIYFTIMHKNKPIIALIAVLFWFLLGANPCYSQKLRTHTVPSSPKPTPAKETKDEGITNVQIGGGVIGSVLYLSRNIKEGNDALGYTIIANYGGHKLLRFSAQYTNYFPINIEPTWYTIKANTIEANVEVLARFKNNKTYLYPFAGLSYNTFKGYFTGMNDYLNLREKYKANSTVISYWMGLNVGTGLEHTIGRFVLFADYRMRVGRSEDRSGITIMDVCYSGGLRLKLWVPTFHKLYRGIHDKYHWF